MFGMGHFLFNPCSNSTSGINIVKPKVKEARYDKTDQIFLPLLNFLNNRFFSNIMPAGFSNCKRKQYRS